MIKYVHPNLIATLAGKADDSLYSEQASLHPTTAYPNAHINVEPAWKLETGKPFVRAGIFDTGIHWDHEDFGYDGSDPASSKVVDGWNFIANMPLKASTKPDEGLTPHGTNCAGILGAIRNNGIGIAGIAGGNDSVNNTGVSLYGLRMLKPTFFSNNLSYIAEAIIGTAIDNDTADYGYGLHISRNSWRFDKRRN